MWCYTPIFLSTQTSEAGGLQGEGQNGMSIMPHFKANKLEFYCYTAKKTIDYQTSCTFYHSSVFLSFLFDEMRGLQNFL